MLKILYFLLFSVLINQSNAFEVFRKVGDSVQPTFYIVYMGLCCIAIIIIAVIALPIFFKRRGIVRNVVRGVTYELLDFGNVAEQKDWIPIKSHHVTTIKPPQKSTKSVKSKKSTRPVNEVNDKTL